MPTCMRTIGYHALWLMMFSIKVTYAAHELSFEDVHKDMILFYGKDAEKVKNDKECADFFKQKNWFKGLTDIAQGRVDCLPNPEHNSRGQEQFYEYNQAYRRLAPFVMALEEQTTENEEKQILSEKISLARGTFLPKVKRESLSMTSNNTVIEPCYTEGITYFTCLHAKCKHRKIGYYVPHDEDPEIFLLERNIDIVNHYCKDLREKRTQQQEKEE